MGWFISASFVSLLLGLLMVNLLQPGANFPGTLPAAGQSTGLPVSAFSIEKFLTHLIPTSIADAMAQNEILQIVIFAVFFAVAMGAMPERSKPMLHLIDDLGHIMLKVTGYVMLFAPLAVWAAIMATVVEERSRRTVEADRLHGRFLSRRWRSSGASWSSSASSSSARATATCCG